MLQQPAEKSNQADAICFAQIGGCNLAQIIRHVPGAYVGAHAVRSSMPSLVSAPLDPALYVEPDCPLKAKFIEADFQKHYTASFVANDWKVLLIDLLRDYLTGSIEVGGAHVTEINDWVHGDPLALDDIFNAPYRVIRWDHPEFFELWAASARKFYDDLLKPRMDAGCHVAVARLSPVHAEYRGNGQGYAVLPDGGAHESSDIMRRMNDFFAALDPRIIMLEVEPEYCVSAFDVDNGAYAYHMVTDYYARAAAILCARIGVPHEVASAHIASCRMAETDRRYRSAMDMEDRLRAEIAEARCDAEGARAMQIEADSRIARLHDDLTAARASLDDLRSMRESQIALAAGLTNRLAREIDRAEDMRRAFQAQERDLRAELVAGAHAVQVLSDERDEMLARFREHITHYDALRDELERRSAADDETYALVLDLAGRIRGFAERCSSLSPATESAALEAGRAMTDLSAKLAQAKRAIASIEDAADVALDTNKSPQPGAPALVRQT